MFFNDFARRPIDDDNPSGTNPNHLEEFDEIKRQINNLNKVTGRVSWKTVQNLSKKILSSNSKDLRCSSYYTVAALHNDGLKGLADGLNALLDICVVYWFSAYPESTKSNARMSSIEWMVENSEKRLKKQSVDEYDLPLIEAIHQLCLRIEEELRLHYGIKAPSMGRIRRILKQWIDEFRELEIRDRELLAEKNKKLAQIVPVQRQVPTLKIDIENPEKKSDKKDIQNPVDSKVIKKSRSPIIYSALALFIVTISFHFIVKEHKLRYLKSQINESSISQLPLVINSLKTHNNTYAEELKSLLIKRIDLLLTDWVFDPIKVSQVNNIDTITALLILLYPDSSSALLLRDNFTVQQQDLESRFQAVHTSFSTARTVFANLKAKHNNEIASQAYEYSNSLFPLLGRIEYAEKETKPAEIERSILLLNTYLYKIRQIQVSHNVKMIK